MGACSLRVKMKRLRMETPHLRMETPLCGRSGGHTGTAPTIPTRAAVLQR